MEGRSLRLSAFGRASRPAVILLGAALVVGCVQTRYVGYDRTQQDEPLNDRQVEYDIDSQFYRDPPDCAVVLPFHAADRSRPFGRVIERALARHLSDRLDRVIGPEERGRLVRRLAVDLSHPGDRRAFANSQGCRFLVEAAAWHDGDVYAVFWSQARIGLEVRMVRVRDDHVVWQARHVATRSDGGLPTSPFSAAVSAFEAGMLRADPDVQLSVADDAARRIVLSLPDTRFSD